MKAIVTGANGFIGSSVVKKLISEGIFVLAISRSFEKSRLQSHPNLRTMELSLDNIYLLEKLVNFEEYNLFYHFAWDGSSGNLRNNEKIQIQNALFTIDCLRIAKNIGCNKFIAAGSIMELEVNEVIYTQESKPGTQYIYGIGKVLAHGLAKPIANQIGISLVWTLITNAYGVGEESPRFINQTLRKIINKKPLEFTSATQNYDFVYIDDVASAFFLLGLYGKENKHYVIGSGNPRPLRNFIEEMCGSLKVSYSPVFGRVPFTGVNLPLQYFSTNDIYYDCGFKPLISFSEGTSRTFEWLRKSE